MELVWLIVAVISFVFTLMFSACFAGALNDEERQAAKAFLFISIIFMALAIFSIYKLAVVSKDNHKQITISTSTLPQIDTIITYSLGKADTVYTYHFVKEDKQ